ncbi:MAG: phosphatase PAP2 family protein [Myxococcota bacterium]
MAAKGLRFRPADVVALGTPALLLAIAAVGGRSAEWIGPALIWASVLACGFTIVVLRSFVAGRVMDVIGTFWVALAIPAVYGTLNLVIDLLNPRLFDELLLQVDLNLFGTHPSVWLEGRMPRWSIDLMILCYASFYFWPLVLAAILYAKGKRRQVDHLALLIVLGFFTNYVGYVSVPLVGPRFAIAPLYDGFPQGWLVGTDLWRSFLYIPTLRDCFPSGHTAMTLLTLAFAYSRLRWFFFAMLPVAIPLIAATVALRFHYTADLVLAVPFAFVVWFLATVWHERSEWKEGLVEGESDIEETGERSSAAAV